MLELLNSIKPIWDAVWNGVEWAFQYVILPYLKTLIENRLPGIILFISSLFDTLDGFFTWLGNVFAGIPGFISNLWGKLEEFGGWLYEKGAAVIDWFGEKWNGVKEIFAGVGEWFREKFTEAWEAVKYVFSSGGAIFDGIVDGIFNVFRDVVNGLIYGINCIIWEPFNAINYALDSIRGVEIMGFAPFEWLPPITIPQIPYLAQGTVVSANYGNFLAVLGDNKREAEVVSPISSIEKAVENVLSRQGMPKEITVVTYLYPNSAAYRREIIKIVNDDNRWNLMLNFTTATI